MTKRRRDLCKFDILMDRDVLDHLRSTIIHDAPPNPKQGRKVAQISREKIQQLSALGYTQKRIAQFFGCSEDTIQRNYKDDYWAGKEDLDAYRRHALIDKAINDKDVKAIQILTDELRSDKSNPDEAGVKLNINITPSSNNGNNVDIQTSDNK